MINEVPSAFQYLASYSFNWSYTFVITNLLREGSSATLNLYIDIAHTELPNLPLKWEIKIVGLKESRINLTDGETRTMKILEDYPLLWKYNDVQAELYFQGICSDPYNLLLELYQVNEPHHNFKSIKHFDQLLRQPGGFIANGPRRLLNQYASLLEKYALQPSIIGEQIPAFQQSKICWIGGNFIIGESFEFVPVDSIL